MDSQRQQADDDSDDDDDVLDDKNDAAVQKLLSKYLKEEDDVDIISAIKGGNTLSGSSGGGIRNGEKYERLPPEERAFWAFTNRVKRAPNNFSKKKFVSGTTTRKNLRSPSTRSTGTRATEV